MMCWYKIIESKDCVFQIDTQTICLYIFVFVCLFLSNRCSLDECEVQNPAIKIMLQIQSFVIDVR